MSAKRFLIICGVIVFIAITILSLLPPRSGMHMPTNDKVGHFIAYSVLSLNLSLIAENKYMRLYLLLAGLSYSILIEFVQGFVGRETSVYDFAANTIGVLVGFLLFKLFGRWIFEVLDRIFGRNTEV